MLRVQIEDGWLVCMEDQRRTYSVQGARGEYRQDVCVGRAKITKRGLGVIRYPQADSVDGVYEAIHEFYEREVK